MQAGDEREVEPRIFRPLKVNSLGGLFCCYDAGKLKGGIIHELFVINCSVIARRGKNDVINLFLHPDWVTAVGVDCCFAISF